MKRSEMLKIMSEAYSDKTKHRRLYFDLEDANRVLTAMEEAGILPPTISGVYDPVPTVTPTGNLDYNYKRGWEAE